MTFARRKGGICFIVLMSDFARPVIVHNVQIGSGSRRTVFTADSIPRDRTRNGSCPADHYGTISGKATVAWTFSLLVSSDAFSKLTPASLW